MKPTKRIYLLGANANTQIDHNSQSESQNFSLRQTDVARFRLDDLQMQ